MTARTPAHHPATPAIAVMSEGSSGGGRDRATRAGPAQLGEQHLALALLAVTAGALTAVEIAVLPAESEAPSWALVAYTLGSVYPAMGLLAWWRVLAVVRYLNG